MTVDENDLGPDYAAGRQAAKEWLDTPQGQAYLAGDDDALLRALTSNPESQDYLQGFSDAAKWAR
jgi:hypothetical protein